MYVWQTCTRKATFIDQVMRGEIAGRSIDDIGDAALSYAEVMALATGNPLIMERAGVAGDLARLERQLAAHRRDQDVLVRTKASSQRRAAQQHKVAAVYQQAAARREDTAGDRFAMVVAGTRYAKRTDAGAALQEDVTARLDRLGPDTSTVAVVGRLGGLDVELTATRDPTGSLRRAGLRRRPRFGDQLHPG